jgi:hypothetical protein
MQARWRLLVLACALASLLVPALASASTGPYAETRVRGLDLGNPYSIRAERPVTLGTHQGYGPAYDDLASDFLLAARGGSALSKAGQAADRGGLTRAGRALAKHGGREGSVFPRPTGNPTAINQQGQTVLDDILGNVSKTSPNKFGGLDYFGGSTGGGARFDAAGNFIGFLEP